MTLNGAIMQLVEMRENSMMPVVFKPYFDKVIETISECVEQSEIPHWISCEERLPENNDPVNVTWINHNPEVYYSDIKDERFTATAHYHNGHWYWYSSVTQDLLDEYGDWDIELIDGGVEIIAWMPMPESYKGK